MTYKKLLLLGFALCLAGVGGQSITANAAEFSINNLVGNVGIAAVTNEEMDASKYLEYQDASVSSSWGYDELGIGRKWGNSRICEREYESCPEGRQAHGL